MSPHHLHYGKIFRVLILLLLQLGSVYSIASTPIRGIHYQEITGHLDSGEYDLIQFFSFSCHHCYKFETDTNSLEIFRGRNNRIKRIPVSFGKNNWEQFAKFYLTLEYLGIEDRYFRAIFNDIHVDRHTKFDLDNLCKRLNMDKKLGRNVKRTFYSAALEKKYEKSQQIVKQYKITGVPALVIKDKYLSDAAMTRGTKQLYSIALYLTGL